jgi:hypothetical protein
MTAARRLAGILIADVGVREHRDGASEKRANVSSLQSSHRRNHARSLKAVALASPTCAPKWSQSHKRPPGFGRGDVAA